MFDVDGKLPMKTRYNNLLRLLTDIRRKFEIKFKKSIDNTPGAKVYMLTHVVFTADDARSSDWFTRFMMDYLVPTQKDMEDFEAMNVDMEKVLLEDGVREDAVAKLLELGWFIAHPYDDEVILRFGMWNRNDDGQVVRPIHFSDTLYTPFKKSRKIDVKKILDEAGLLHLATGEIVISSDIVE